MSPSVRPVLGMILKGYPRISETFISNEILLLEKMGFNIHLFSMRRGRENFTHKSVQNIQAQVDYLPETLVAPLPKFLFHNIQLATRKPRAYAGALKTAFRRFRRTHKSATIKHFGRPLTGVSTTCWINTVCADAVRMVSCICMALSHNLKSSLIKWGPSGSR